MVVMRILHYKTFMQLCCFFLLSTDIRKCMEGKEKKQEYSWLSYSNRLQTNSHITQNFSWKL